MPDVPTEVEQSLSNMDEGQWSAFVAKVRAPDAEEEFRAAVAKHVSGDRLEAVLKVANRSAFVGESGQIDEAKVASQIGALFSTTAPAGPSHQNFGQNTPAPPFPGPGEMGRAEAAKRFGDAQRDPATPSARGQSGRQEAARRFAKKEQR